MELPFEPVIAGYSINIHLVLEYLAFFIAYRYYVFQRKRSNDSISSSNRLTIILGAIIGAFIGSRVFGYLENPYFDLSQINLQLLLNVKTIMGGLFGGMLGVEIIKWKIGETQSSGDLFTLPIILGILIGRIGCFLTGINEPTFGVETSFFTGMDLGDGLSRHPIALYEIIFLVFLFFFLRKLMKKPNLENGYIFQLFMLSYFSFRFFIEFIKPNTFTVFSLSSIQWLCVACIIYYRKTIIKTFKYAG